jgi:hypothetical protein
MLSSLRPSFARNLIRWSATRIPKAVPWTLAVPSEIWAIDAA